MLKNNTIIAGFTLIEILIVMLIISIIGGVSLLTISHHRETELANLSKRLANSLILAEQQALLQPAVLGLAFTAHGFQFYEYHEPTSKDQKNPWQLLNDSALGPHRFAKDIQITLKIEGQTVTSTEETLPKPQLIISGGDIPAFVILIGKIDEHAVYQVVGESNGNIKSEKIPDEK